MHDSVVLDILDTDGEIEIIGQYLRYHNSIYRISQYYDIVNSNGMIILE